MKVEQALTLINQGIVYRPGYRIMAEDNTPRYGNAIKVGIYCPTVDSGTRDSEEWKQGYPTVVADPGARAEFTLTVDDCADEYDVLKKLLQLITRVEQHEAREFLRLKSSGRAPFHPHTSDGIRRWGTPELDFTYGLA
jgi:hypothetical protein